MSELKREVRFKPAFDRISEGYGIGALRVTLLLRGPFGAIHFEFSTGMYLREVHERSRALAEITPPWAAFSLVYHTIFPRSREQKPAHNKCDFLDGRACYGETFSMERTEGMLETLVREGGDATWAQLEELYRKS